MNIKQFRVYMIALGCFIITSCTPATLRPPPQYNIDQALVLGDSYNTVWNRVSEFITVTGQPIQFLDRSSGIVYTNFLKYSMVVGDCGGALDEEIYTSSASLNIFVRRLARDTTKITINVAPQFPPGYEAWDNNKCVSTGGLERLFFNFLRNPDTLK